MVFKEVQRFNQWWLWLILIAVATLPIYGIISQIILKNPSGSKSMSDLGLIIFSLLVFAFIFLFSQIKLTTEIDKYEIRLRLIPFFRKKIKWTDIESFKVLNYGFVGGWGIRLYTAYGTVYNIKGNKGLALVLKNGKKLVIGTQKEKELASFLKNSTLKL